MVRSASLLSLIITLICVILLLSACKKDELLDTQEAQARSFPNVDPRLWPLFEAFEQEAAARGFEVDLNKARISGEIASISEQHVAGQCSYNQVSGDVTVDREFWANSNGNFQEFIVFHELGHCYLHRAHREDADEQGNCISVMRSGLEDCRDNYNSLTREQFIDELFNPEQF